MEQLLIGSACEIFICGTVCAREVAMSPNSAPHRSTILPHVGSHNQTAPVGTNHELCTNGNHSDPRRREARTFADPWTPKIKSGQAGRRWHSGEMSDGDARAALYPSSASKSFLDQRWRNSKCPGIWAPKVDDLMRRETTGKPPMMATEIDIGLPCDMSPKPEKIRTAHPRTTLIDGIETGPTGRMTSEATPGAAHRPSLSRPRAPGAAVPFPDRACPAPLGRHAGANRDEDFSRQKRRCSSRFARFHRLSWGVRRTTGATRSSLGPIIGKGKVELKVFGREGLDRRVLARVDAVGGPDQETKDQRHSRVEAQPPRRSCRGDRPS